MPAKTKMKEYVTKMFSTKESTSSTDRLLASQISGLAAPSSVAPLLFHSLPIKASSYQKRPSVYQPTTVSVHVNTRYGKVPQGEPEVHGYEPTYYRSKSSSWTKLLKYFRRSSMSGEGQLEQNLRQVYAAGEGQDLDAKHPSIQDGEDHATETQSSRLGPQVLAALSVSMGSLIVGFASGYTSPASVSMKDTADFEVSAEAVSWIGGIMPLSALLGGIAGGPMIDMLGRKRTILSTAFPFVLSWLMIEFATSVPLILAGRALAGFCTGLITLVLPVYLGETVKPEVRGMLGLLPTAFGNTGILLAFTAGMFLNWRHLALLGAMLPVPFVILMCIIPETPAWYLGKGRAPEAQTALQWLRGKDSNITHEFHDVQQNVQQNQKGATTFANLLTKANMKPVAITLGLMFFQQLSGINAVIFYTVDIFQDTGSKLDGNICTIIIGCVNFIATFAATAVIDRMGRKMLLFISSISMTITLFGLGTYIYLKDNTDIDVTAYSVVPLISLVFYIIGFSLGLGPIPWLMMGEILPAKIRGPAASLATAFNWTCTSLVTLTFNGIQASLGMGLTFLMFGGICFVSFFFVLFCVPETRGKSLEDIERKFQKTRRMSSIANLRPSPMSV